MEDAFIKDDNVNMMEVDPLVIDLADEDDDDAFDDDEDEDEPARSWAFWPIYPNPVWTQPNGIE